MKDKIIYKGFEITNKDKIEYITNEIEEDLACLTDDEMILLKETTGVSDLTDIISSHTFKYFEDKFGEDSRITFYTWFAKLNFNENIAKEMCGELQRIANEISDNVNVIYTDLDLLSNKINIDIRLENRLCMNIIKDNEVDKRTFSTYNHLKRIFIKIAEEHSR